jgi:outer membrane protein W
LKYQVLKGTPVRLSTSIILIAAVALLLVLPAAAHAQQGKYYMTVKAGAYFPANDEFDDGFAGEFSFGAYVRPQLALEGTLGVVWLGDFNGSVDTLFGPVPADIDVTATPLTFTVKWVLPRQYTEFYLGAGAGLYFITAEALFFDSGFPVLIDENEIVFGGHLVAGFSADVGRRTFLGLEAKYTSTENAAMRIANTSLDLEVEGFTLTGLIGFRF